MRTQTRQQAAGSNCNTQPACGQPYASRTATLSILFYHIFTAEASTNPRARLKRGSSRKAFAVQAQHTQKHRSTRGNLQGQDRETRAIHRSGERHSSMRGRQGIREQASLSPVRTCPASRPVAEQPFCFRVGLRWGGDSCPEQCDVRATTRQEVPDTTL